MLVRWLSCPACSGRGLLGGWRVLAVLGLLLVLLPLCQGKGAQEDVSIYPAVCGMDWCPSWLPVRHCELDWGRGDHAPGQRRLRFLLPARAQKPAETLAPAGLQISLRCLELKTPLGSKPKASLLCFPIPLGLDWRDHSARLFSSGPSVATALRGARLLPGSVSVCHSLERVVRDAGGWKYFISGRNP